MQKKNQANAIKIPFQHSKGKKETDLLLEQDKKRLEESLNELVIFSWKYFDRDHEVYNCGGVEMSWFISLMDSLKNVSSLTINDLRLENGKRQGLRFHPIRWEKVQHKFNFNRSFFEQIEENSYQLSLSTANGRIHGFLIENRFYIVWFDPYHQLELMKGFGGVKTFEPPINEFDALQEQFCSLSKAYDDLEKEFYEYLEENTK
ncbi:hypothetical protein SFC52_01225 [Niallia circulans]